MNEAKDFKDYVNSYDDNCNVHYIILNYIISEYSLTDMLELVQTIIHKVSNSLTKILGTIRESNYRATCIKTYLDGEMYTDQDSPSDYDKVQSKNADVIINSTAGVLGIDLICDNDRVD